MSWQGERNEFALLFPHDFPLPRTIRGTFVPAAPGDDSCNGIMADATRLMGVPEKLKNSNAPRAGSRVIIISMGGHSCAGDFTRPMKCYRSIRIFECMAKPDTWWLVEYLIVSWVTKSCKQVKNF